jgi:hypothetical protein
MGPLATLLDHMMVWDPSYFEDFWAVPGYQGVDPPESLKKALIRQHRTTIRRVVMVEEARGKGLPLPMAARSAGAAGIVPAAFQLADVPAGELVGAGLAVAGGHTLYITGVFGDLITLGYGPDAGVIVNNIKPGDEVVVDNSVYLATQTYHRHQVPTTDFYVWDQFRAPDGKELYPQRSENLGARYNRLGGGSVESGRFQGKMIMVASLMDEYAYPWNADWYRNKVRLRLGEHLDESYRIWFTDHALHGGPAKPTDNVRVINYTGLLHQALRDLSAWVEKGTPPPSSTSYTVADGQVLVPPRAAERKGIQPVVALSADGGVRADVRVGQPVSFVGVIETPPGAGKVTGAEWDFEGRGDYPAPGKIARPAARTTVKAAYAFSEPGTYFPALRAWSHRHGDAESPYARVRNLARVRVVVT